MKKPDNVVFNYENNSYDSFKRAYPTSFNSKTFNIEKIENLEHKARPYFNSKVQELKEQYEKIINELNWNQRISNSKYNFNPIIGETYYLYKTNNREFLSIIKPNEWKISLIGAFKLRSNHIWEKIN